MAGTAPPTPGWYRIGPAGMEYRDDELAADAVLIDTDGEHVLAWQGTGHDVAMPGGTVVPTGVTTEVRDWQAIDWPEA